MYKSYFRTLKINLINSRIKKDPKIVIIEIPSNFKFQTSIFVDTKGKLVKTKEDKDAFLFRELESSNNYNHESWRLFGDWNVNIQGDGAHVLLSNVL